MKITYSSRAVSDLHEIGGYLASRNPRGAFAVERRIREVVERIAEFPGIGSKLSQRPAVRVMPLGGYPYLVFYKTLGDELIVLHIRHGARRPVDPGEL